MSNESSAIVQRTGITARFFATIESATAQVLGGVRRWVRWRSRLGALWMARGYAAVTATKWKKILTALRAGGWPVSLQEHR